MSLPHIQANSASYPSLDGWESQRDFSTLFNARVNLVQPVGEDDATVANTFCKMLSCIFKFIITKSRDNQWLKWARMRWARQRHPRSFWGPNVTSSLRNTVLWYAMPRKSSHISTDHTAAAALQQAAMKLSSQYRLPAISMRTY